MIFSSKRVDLVKRVTPSFVPIANSPMYLEPSSVSRVLRRSSSFLSAVALTTRPFSNQSLIPSTSLPL